MTRCENVKAISEAGGFDRALPTVTARPSVPMPKSAPGEITRFLLAWNELLVGEHDSPVQCTSGSSNRIQNTKRRNKTVKSFRKQKTFGVSKRVNQPRSRKGRRHI